MRFNNHMWFGAGSIVKFPITEILESGVIYCKKSNSYSTLIKMFHSLICDVNISVLNLNFSANFRYK